MAEAEHKKIDDTADIFAHLPDERCDVREPWEIEHVAAELIHELVDTLKTVGVDFEYCQLASVIGAHAAGRLEVESMGPYVMDHGFSEDPETVRRVMRSGKLLPEERIGLAIAGALKTIFPYAAIVSLCDDRSFMPDNAMPSGAPFAECPTKRVPLSSEVKQAFLEEVERLFHETFEAHGVPSDTNTETVLLLESDLEAHAPQLVEMLRASPGCAVEEVTARDGRGNIIGTKLVLKIDNPENPACREIILRDARGQWTCTALDATGYIRHLENSERCHLIILPENMRAQQDEVWAIFGALKFFGEKGRDRYQNVFFDEAKCADPTIIATAIKTAFERAMATDDVVVNIADRKRLAQRIATPLGETAEAA